LVYRGRPEGGRVTLQFSRRLAVLIGVVTPSIETIRRWHELRTLTVWWPAYIDDILLGAFLLYGAGRAGDEQSSGRAVLAAAWGFMCGIAYSSLFTQLGRLSVNLIRLVLRPAWSSRSKPLGSLSASQDS
jgi:hypothetical protein